MFCILFWNFIFLAAYLDRTVWHMHVDGT
jgi:hypothetical protein